MTVASIFSRYRHQVELGRQETGFRPGDDRDPVLSVVVSTYNKERFLPHLIGSLEDQIGEAPFEVVSVDDASTDGSHELMTDHGRINTAQLTTNSGSESLPFYVAAHLARGQYIAFVDADDYLGTRSTVEETVGVFEEDPKVFFSQSNTVIQIEDPDRMSPQFAWALPGQWEAHPYDPAETDLLPRGTTDKTVFSVRPAKDWDRFDLLVHPYCSGLRVFRRDALDQLSGWPPALARSLDYELVVKAMKLSLVQTGYKIFAHDHDSYVYGIHATADNQTVYDDRGVTEEMRHLALPIIRELGITWPEIVEASARQRADGADNLIDTLQLEEHDLDPR